jgi:hypothetical protein
LPRSRYGFENRRGCKPSKSSNPFSSALKTASPSTSRTEHDAGDEAAVCSPFAPPSADVCKDPLERALELAAEAGRFDVVAKLADEIHARRLHAEGVTSITRKRSG